LERRVRGLSHSLGVCSLVALIAVGGRAGQVRAAPPPDTEPSLAEQILTDVATEAAWHAGRSATAFVRKKFVRESDLAKFGLRLEDNWEELDPARPVVILVHGFNSTPQQNAALMVPVRASGYPCGSFSYPNDYLLGQSAKLLSRDLHRFERQHPNRRLILVCHSMGGLIARACIEDPNLDPGNVERLIMIAPPTHGTMIAHFGIGADVWEHWLARREGQFKERMRDSVVDGLDEAAIDLCPKSEFLTKLNARPLNPNVRYTNLLGTGAHLTESQVAWMREQICDCMAKLPGGERRSQEYEKLLADLDEMVKGKGDGVVAVKRGRLNGVSDTLILPFGHIAVTGEPKNDVLREVQHIVLARVK
jgi:pimeloyl-ACP methyl ester carboxylesterase